MAMKASLFQRPNEAVSRVVQEEVEKYRRRT
jgi:hypothetical protein